MVTREFFTLSLSVRVISLHAVVQELIMVKQHPSKLPIMHFSRGFSTGEEVDHTLFYNMYCTFKWSSSLLNCTWVYY